MRPPFYWLLRRLRPRTLTAVLPLLSGITVDVGRPGAGGAAVAHARVIIPLGEAPTRLNCARLYELEIQKLKAEIEMLKIGLE